MCLLKHHHVTICRSNVRAVPQALYPSALGSELVLYIEYLDILLCEQIELEAVFLTYQKLS